MNSIRIDIGGIITCIKSEVSGVIARFEEMYHGFKTDTNTTQLTLEIKCVELNEYIQHGALPFKHNDGDVISNYFYAAQYNPKDHEAILITNFDNIYGFAEEYLTKLISYVCLENRKLLFHCATLIDARENAYVFYGPSGIGKSTVARNSANLMVVSDDIVILEKDTQGKYKIYKTPLERNKQNSHMAGSFNLKGMYRLNQAPTNLLIPLPPPQHVSKILGNMWNLDFSKDGYSRALDIIASDYKDIPGYDLFTEKGFDFWTLIH